MKKFIYYIILLCFPVLLITGCGSNEEDEHIIAWELIDLDWFSSSSDDQEYYEDEPDPIVGESKITADFIGLHVYESEYSGQSLDYIVYAPEETTEETPIFMFLHGNSDPGETPSEMINKYKYLRYLNQSLWRPDVIIVIPINSKKSHWSSDIKKLDTILHECINNFGGSYDNMYISGASAGADAMNTVAKSIPFKGAVFMAGHMNGGGLSATDFCKLWEGKTVYYYRDNLLGGGGYGYNKEYVNKVKDNADSYNMYFEMIDLNWNHDYALVDAVFLPSGYSDKKGQSCHDAISTVVNK